ncbi:MAG: SDR family NAD(P)-dependent oxidoreductase [Novosphingobium sp.]
MEQRLSGKVALVTGGTAGIGAGTVRRLSAEGAAVVFTGSNRDAAERICEETGAHFVAHRVEDAAGWGPLMADIAAHYGRLDIAFSNAGTELGDASIEDIEFAQWDKLVAINLTGMMLAARHAVQAMRANPGGPTGSIVLNSSMNAYKAMGNYVAYSTTKCALIGLAKSVAMHCANQGLKIRCNTIHPGVVETEMIRSVIDRAPDPAAARAQLEAMAPLGRMARVEEVAALVAFLAGDEAAFITGSEYGIDGASTAGMMGV